MEPPPRKPTCPLCFTPIKLMDLSTVDKLRPKDCGVGWPIDKVLINGILWHKLEHVQRSRVHPVSNCCLSLTPISFPYRKCRFCNVICGKSPSFGQAECTFCNGRIEIPEGYLKEGEGPGGGGDLTVELDNEVN